MLALKITIQYFWSQKVEVDSLTKVDSNQSEEQSFFLTLVESYLSDEQTYIYLTTASPLFWVLEDRG